MDAENVLSINKKINVQIGYYNNTQSYPEYNILWFPLGTYIIISCAISESDGGLVASLQLQDKMCLLNGFAGGTIPAAADLHLLDTLDEKGILYAVNSNKPDKFSNYIVNSLFPEKHFSCVIGKRDGFERKPAPDGIREIQRITGIADDECMYIGDSDVDVYTAKNAGIKFCGAEWGFRGAAELEKAGAEHIAKNTDELLAYILGN